MQCLESSTMADISGGMKTVNSVTLESSQCACPIDQKKRSTNQIKLHLRNR